MYSPAYRPALSRPTLFRSSLRTNPVVPVMIAVLAVVLGLVVMVAPAFAASSDVKINEFSSNNPDFVELINTGSATVDLSGWVLKDSSEKDSYTFPAGSSIAGGAIKGLSGEGVDFAFGLGNGDAVRLYNAAATAIDTFTYPAHPAAGKSYGRCPDGTGDIVITASATKGAANSCAPAPPPDVVINEVESNGDQVADWVELKNRSASAVDVSGWKIVDGDAAHAATPVVVPAGTTIAAGGYYAIYTELNQSPGFGLGVGDSVTLYLADGTTQIDTTTWGAHAPTTWGRCPDGTGAFGDTTTSTRGAANACSPVRINEVESDGGTPADWVELTNISASPVDVSGYVVKDSDDAHAFTIAGGTSVPAKGYLVLDQADLGFELDATDSVRLFAADGTTLIESYAWTSAATQSYGRCKDGVGDFRDTKAPTKGAANSCPGLETSPWPGAQTVTYADRTETFPGDLSGLAFDPANPDVLWAAQNKKGTLYKLTRDADDNFVPAAGWPRDPKYVGGSGSVDSEGIAIGPDGFVYLTSERDNEASGISKNAILRYDPSSPAGATITPTSQWDLNSFLPTVGSNLGLEGVTFVPDSFLTANGFKDQSTGVAYDPATYPLHGSGLYFVALEANGALYGFALDSDGHTAHKVATVASGFPALADVDFDPELNRLRAVTDDTVDGKTSLLKIDGSGDFVVDAAYDRPAGMPNLNNEGLAVAPQSRCVDGKKEVLWADDGDTDLHSLRRGSIDCTVLALTAPVPTLSGTPTVGQTLTAAAGSWGPGQVDLSYAWFAGANQITGAATDTLVVPADAAGATITVEVTGTKADYPTVTKTSAPTAAVAKGALTAPTPTITGTPTVGQTLTAVPGTWGPDPVALTYQWFAGSTPITAATSSPTVVLEGSQAEATITVVVTGTKSGYTTAAKTSSPTAPVAPGTLTTSVPVVTGTPALGETLTADAGVWGPSVFALSYRWSADGVRIAGATDDVLVLGVDQVGKAITVTVTGTKFGYTSAVRTSTPTDDVAPGTLTGAVPTTSGTAKVGVKLTADAGTWGPSPVALTYQWLANGAAVAGATSATFTPTAAQVGMSVSVKVTGTKDGYAALSRTSAGRTVAVGTLTPGTPKITGTAKVGSVLKATAGTWQPTGVGFSYRWLADGKVISGATRSSLTLGASVKGKKITVRVTGTKAGYASRSVTSAATKAVVTK